MDTHAAKPAAGDPSEGNTPRSPLLQRAIEIAGGVRRRVRDQLDVVLHARRRASARAALGACPPPQSILFICHGNICRSSYAEFAFLAAADAAALPMQVGSAGFISPGRRPPEAALASASRRGFDMSEHRSRLITQPLLDDSDVIVVMTGEQGNILRRRVASSVILVLGDLDPRPIEQRAIRDPWGADESVFDASYERIDRCLRELVGVLSAPGARVTR